MQWNSAEKKWAHLNILSELIACEFVGVSLADAVFMGEQYLIESGKLIY